MSTVATAAMRQLAADWEKLWKSAQISGIVPDARHLRQGGYHCSRQDQVDKSNYSVVRPDDKLGPDNAAAAIDMTMNRADMIACTKRRVTVFADASDPRRKYINAFNGTLDGSTALRWDVYARKRTSASSDHTWHVHMEVRRKYVESSSAMAAILSVLKGQSKAAFLGSVPAVQSQRPAFPGTLRRSSSQKSPDPSVKMLQVQLGKRGLTFGTADGLFGPKVEAAVKEWQRRSKLTVDGIVGPKTWASLWA